MPMLPFSDYRPDLSAYQAGGSSQLIQNVVPRGDGYGPFPGLNAYTQALPAPCRGFFYARKTDGSIAVFAGTATDLYLLNNTNFSWILVSKGGVSYSVLPPANHWQFAQFGSNVIAVQPNKCRRSMTPRHRPRLPTSAARRRKPRTSRWSGASWCSRGFCRRLIASNGRA